GGVRAARGEVRPPRRPCPLRTGVRAGGQVSGEGGRRRGLDPRRPLSDSPARLPPAKLIANHSCLRLSCAPLSRDVSGLPSASRRSWWLKTLHRWHWISAAVSLAGLLVFSATGITLNHAAQIESTARVSTVTGTLPARLSTGLADARADAPLPEPVAGWLADA